jgi:outer membrane protein assembly factor BamB
MAHLGYGSVSTLQAYQGSRLLRVGSMSFNSMGDEVVATDDAKQGKAWSLKLDGDAHAVGGFLAAPPAAAGGRPVIGTFSGTLKIVDPKKGSISASYDVGHPIRSQPVVVDGWIYVGTDDGRLVAIDTGDASITGWTHWGGNAARTGT